ncbi:uncharacterized protein [Spinacia oleracea]|uniref:DUF4283 domain-containing protein n=1 Tax=Spinacia oleracea TaxID=3562 RepID=A0ABM3RIG0_SPIOL|nr:uncharacterized protein LOC130469902 [Spinacia oleracea]
MGVDEVALVGKGIFLVRFTTMENCAKILQGGTQFFDSKPLILKPWSPDINYAKEDVKTLPIWIKLSDLDVKYWGDKSMFKIAGQVGTPIKVDQATMHRDKLMFTKILVDVKIDQHFPSVIQFVNEKGVIVDQKVTYDWLPHSCTNYKGIGHKAEVCKQAKKQPKTKKIWVQKVAPHST